MSRPGVTREQVFAAATALSEEGIQPSVKLVRDRIGGSFSTITPHLAAWKEERGGRGAPAIPDMPENVTAAVRQVWAAAWSAGQQAIQAEREGLAALRKEMEQERDELAHEITELEAKIDAALTERDTLATKLNEETQAKARLEDAVTRERIENARLTERVANGESRAQELRAQVQELQREFARLAEAHAERSAKAKRGKTPEGSADAET